MKAVIYARYSSDNQREESIEGQLRECTAYCVKNDITILRTYIDRALSAKTDNRPDFQRMVKDSAKGLFDVVIVWKLDRFARNRYDSAHYKAQLRKYGVKVLSATENISEGPEGIILESMLEGMAEYYSAELSEKVIRGHTENALKCKYNGGTPTFGYVIDKDMQYQLDPRTAPVVLEIFTRYDQGATMKEIMEEMRQKGVTTVRGKKIDLNFMARLLKNRKYIGEYSYREIVTPGGIPAIVPQDLFDRVQKRLAANRKAPARHKAEDDYLLTTKLFCGTCGAMMVGESGTSASKGRKYHYYRCVNTKKQKSCNAKHKSIRKTPIENAVVNAVMAKVMDDNFVEYIADTVMDIQTRESSVLPALRHQLEETERGITNMLNAIQMGIINASTKQRLDELEDRKADIELQIIQEEMKHPMLTREDVTYWICRFRTLDVSKLEERRRLIDSFVNSVTVFDDYILITFNYKEGEERLDFTDIESSDLQSVGGPILSEKTPEMAVFLHLMLDFICTCELWRCRMGVVSASEYVASLNEEQQRPINAFIEFMNVEYAQLTNKISFSMPMWLVGKKMNEGYVAVSAAKNHFSIHFSDEAFLNRLAERLPTCKKGKRCINVKYGDEQSLRAVEESISNFLKIYGSEGSPSQ